MQGCLPLRLAMRRRLSRGYVRASPNPMRYKIDGASSKLTARA